MLVRLAPRRPAPESGFSLIEVAVVLLIVSVLLGGLLISLSATRELSNRGQAEAQLEEIAEALYGFAQINGRLPCPATAASSGAESPIGGGNCNQPHGFVPAATLGLSGPVNADGLYSDPWLNPYRYSVTTANANAFTTANGMRALGLGALTPDLRVCSAAACAAEIASSVPAVILSMGADWADFNAADVDATENAGEATIAGYRHGNDANFVQSTYIEDQFDDLLTWLSPAILYTRMITAGQLP